MLSAAHAEAVYKQGEVIASCSPVHVDMRSRLQHLCACAVCGVCKRVCVCGVCVRACVRACIDR
jgi:hypothetical protein